MRLQLYSIFDHYLSTYLNARSEQALSSQFFEANQTIAHQLLSRHQITVPAHCKRVRPTRAIMFIIYKLPKGLNAGEAVVLGKTESKQTKVQSSAELKLNRAE